MDIYLYIYKIDKYIDRLRERERERERYGIYACVLIIEN